MEGDPSTFLNSSVIDGLLARFVPLSSHEKLETLFMSHNAPPHASFWRFCRVLTSNQAIVGSCPTGCARNVCRHRISSRAEDTRSKRKGPLDGADPPSFSARVVDPTQSSRDVPVNLTLQLTRRESLSVILGGTC